MQTQVTISFVEIKFLQMLSLSKREQKQQVSHEITFPFRNWDMNKQNPFSFVYLFCFI